MDIERVNEHTVKFFISYRDIEDRGFDREEIWYDRERSEELFWEMMDEVNDREGFTLDGPLWIQVQAFDKGLEIIVTKAQLSKDGSKLELPISDGKPMDVTDDDDNIEHLFEQQYLVSSEHVIFDESSRSSDDTSSPKRFLIRFADFEDVIRLSHHFTNDLANDLYVMDDQYYLYVTFAKDDTKDDIKNIISQLLEFGKRTKVTIHRLQEYGKRLMKDTALNQIKEYFANT